MLTSETAVLFASVTVVTVAIVSMLCADGGFVTSRPGIHNHIFTGLRNISCPRYLFSLGLLTFIGSTIYLSLAGGTCLWGNDPIVRELQPATPAFSSGLKVGDLLESVNTMKFEDWGQLREIADRIRPGDALNLEVWSPGVGKHSVSLKRPADDTMEVFQLGMEPGSLSHRYNLLEAATVTTEFATEIVAARIRALLNPSQDTMVDSPVDQQKPVNIAYTMTMLALVRVFLVLFILGVSFAALPGIRWVLRAVSRAEVEVAGPVGEAVKVRAQ